MQSEAAHEPFMQETGRACTRPGLQQKRATPAEPPQKEISTAYKTGKSCSKGEPLLLCPSCRFWVQSCGKCPGRMGSSTHTANCTVTGTGETRNDERCIKLPQGGEGGQPPDGWGKQQVASLQFLCENPRRGEWLESLKVGKSNALGSGFELVHQASCADALA
eukprot:1136982-Pelagomonas_calceolata.AAC.3